MIKLIPQMPAREYYKYACGGVPCLSQSIAHTLVCESPAKAYLQHPQLGHTPRKATEDMEDGSAFHALILGCGATVVEIHEESFRSKHAQEMRDMARDAGKVPILSEKLARIQRAAEVARTKITAFGYPLDGQSEIAVFWEETTSDGEIVQCSGMFDHLRGGARALDVKKCASANPASLPRHMTDFGYDLQEAAYRRALCAVFPEFAGREKLTFLCCELPAPCSVTPVECGGTMHALGELKWRRAVDLWARCLSSGEWPDYTTETVRAEAPMYEINRWMTQL